MEKSAARMPTFLEFFSGGPRAIRRPWSTIPRSDRWTLIASVLLLVPVLLFSVATTQWLASPATPVQSPLSGSWDCSLAGEAIGVLSVTGSTYVLGTPSAGEPLVGTIERVGKHSKLQEEFIKVQSGTLREDFGIRLGFHNAVVEPEALVFNIGPGSGIRCARM